MQGWGEGVVEQLASDLKRAFPSTTGFSAINLWRMRQLHETYTAPDYLSQRMRETPRAASVLPANAGTLPLEPYADQQLVRWIGRVCEQRGR